MEHSRGSQAALLRAGQGQQRLHASAGQPGSPAAGARTSLGRPLVILGRAAIWKPDPLDENPIIVYLDIYKVYIEIYENLTSHNRISR
jgi:hypothetical protein